MQQLRHVVTGRIVGMNDPVFLAEEAAARPERVRTDLENPAPALRTRSLAASSFSRTFSATGRRWEIPAGSASTASGSAGSVRAEVDRDGQLLLRGYIGFRFSVATKWSDADASPDDTARMPERARPYLPDGAPAPRCAT